MRLRKETELQRSDFYKNNLQKITTLYEPAMRLEENSSTFSESMVGEFVLAPFLVLFTMWVLKSAEKDGVKRLYFLARDGFPAYEMALKFCEHYSIGIECRYLYCSRYSLRMPMYSENLDEMLEYVCRSGIDVTLDKVLKRSGLTEQQIAKLDCEKLLWKRNEVLSYMQLREVRSFLKNNNNFLEMVKENSKNGWQVLSDYFRQEGLATTDCIGLVDSGWIGSTQKSICDILKRMHISPNIEGYYWGLYDIPDCMDQTRYHGFYFEKKNSLINKIYFSNCLVETIYSANHGTTTGYMVLENKIIPCQQQIFENGHFLERFGSLIHGYTDKFLEGCSKSAFTKLDIESSIKILSKSMMRFMEQPTVKEAELFGTLQFSDDMLDDNKKELGPVFSKKELRENHFWSRVLNASGVTNKKIHESAWFGATVRRSTDKIWWHNCSFSAYRLLSYLKKSF